VKPAEAMMGLAARNFNNARRSFNVFAGSALGDDMPFSFAETLYTHLALGRLPIGYTGR
jgi:hypothetical protein